MSSRTRVLALSAAILAVIPGCTDRSVMGPEAVSRHNEQSELLGGLLGGVTSGLLSILIPPVERTTPLAQDITWSFTVGPAGATSSNAASGLTIRVPAYAVSTTTTITVTALAGSPVAYEFQPHGLQFNRDVILTQNLSGTTAAGLFGLLTPLHGAYFGSDSLEVNPGGLAIVTELIPAAVNVFTQKASFPIEHFSGYILASGRGGRGSDGNQ